MNETRHADQSPHRAAIVTGATKGIGMAIVRQLAANNYDVALCARNEDELQKVLAELSRTYPGGRFFGKKANMENTEEVTAFAEYALSSLGGVDVLVNNAGLFIPKPTAEEELIDLQRQMSVNLYAPYILCKQVSGIMLARKSGHIINICSIASARPVVSAGSYSITKAALLSLTRVLREEYQSSGIKVSAILPGSTLTDSWSGTTIPPDRFVQAEDVADAVISCIHMSPGANIDELIIRPREGDI